MADYKIYILNQIGSVVASADILTNLHITLSTNNIHAVMLTLPDTFGIDKVFEDYRLAVYRNNKLIGDTQFIIQQIARSIDLSGHKSIEIGALGPVKILDWPIIAYNAGTSQAVKSGTADDLIKEIADENLGSSATDTDRDMSAYLTIDADLSAAATIQKSFSRRNVLTVCQELAQASATAGTRLYFDIVFSAGNFQLRTYTGQRGTDLTDGVVLSPDRQNLKQLKITSDYSDMINYVYAGGQGQEADRNVQTASDATRIANSVWGRIKEQWRDARHVTLTASVQDEADTVLRNGRERITAVGTYLDTAGQPWDNFVTWGDLVNLQFDSNSTVYTAHIDPVTIALANGVETITCGFQVEV